MEALQKENAELKQELEELKEKLKKYTNPDRCKSYYQKNKEKIIQNVKAYQERKKVEFAT